MNFRFYGIFLFSIFTFTINGYIYQADIYDKLICFGDVHFGSFPGIEHPILKNEYIKAINKNHSSNIIQIVSKDNFDDLIVVIEDIYDYEKDHEIDSFFSKMQESIAKQSYSSCLRATNKLCTLHKIPCINIEFRQPYSLFFCRNKANAEVFLEHLDGIIKEIQKYNDLPFLNKFYKETINNLIDQNSSFIKLLKENKNKLIKEIVPDDKHFKLMNNFVDAYHKLFDVKLLHTIFEFSKTDKKIFAITGNNHIKRLKTYFEKMGWKHLYHFSSPDPKSPIDFELTINKLFLQNQNPSNISQDFVANFILLILILLIPATVKEFIYAANRKKQRCDNQLKLEQQC